MRSGRGSGMLGRALPRATPPCRLALEASGTVAGDGSRGSPSVRAGAVGCPREPAGCRGDGDGRLLGADELGAGRAACVAERGALEFGLALTPVGSSTVFTTDAVPSAMLVEGGLVTSGTLEVTGAAADVAAVTTGSMTSCVAVSTTGATASATRATGGVAVAESTVSVTEAVTAATVDPSAPTGSPEDSEEAAVAPPGSPAANADGAYALHRAATAVAMSARRVTSRP